MSSNNPILGTNTSNLEKHWLVGSANTPDEQKKQGRVFTVVLFAFIVVFLLVILLVGMRVYSSVDATRQASDEARLGLSLLANNVRMNDTAGAVGVGEGPEGPSLVLTERLESGTYETRIYAYQGLIVEEYSAASNAYTPERAREVVQSERFEFEYKNGLLSIYTDSGKVEIALHCTGGGS